MELKEQLLDLGAGEKWIFFVSAIYFDGGDCDGGGGCGSDSNVE